MTNLSDILNPTINETQVAASQVAQTLRDLIQQTDGTVRLIESLCAQHGKAAILAEMTEADQALFGWIWGKIGSAAEGTGYTVPTLSEEGE